MRLNLGPNWLRATVLGLLVVIAALLWQLGQNQPVTAQVPGAGAKWEYCILATSKDKSTLLWGNKSTTGKDAKDLAVQLKIPLAKESSEGEMMVKVMDWLDGQGWELVTQNFGVSTFKRRL